GGSCADPAWGRRLPRSRRAFLTDAFFADLGLRLLRDRLPRARPELLSDVRGGARSPDRRYTGICPESDIDRRAVRARDDGVMRILAAIVGVLALFALFVAGAGFILIGFADQNAADHVYVVKFARPGDDCGPEELALDVKDGHTLACTVGIPYEEPHVDLPGFTDEQNAAVQSLAAELGVGGLSEPEQRRIQAEVD